MTRARNAGRLASYWAAGSPARVVEVAEPVIPDPPAPAVEPRPGELRHGYTLADLQRLANSAAANNYTMAADHSDLVHAAWSAIVDLLYTAEEPLTRHDLATEGRKGIWALVKDHRQTYGYRDRDPYNGVGSAPHFALFWHQPAEASHEERFVEQVAVWQVFNTLTDRQREVLLAAAVHDGDYVAAALSLNMAPGSYRTWLSQARRAAAAQWHAPSRTGPSRGGAPSTVASTVARSPRTAPRVRYAATAPGASGCVRRAHRSAPPTSGNARLAVELSRRGRARPGSRPSPAVCLMGRGRLVRSRTTLIVLPKRIAKTY